MIEGNESGHLFHVEVTPAQHFKEYIAISYLFNVLLQILTLQST